MKKINYPILLLLGHKNSQELIKEDIKKILPKENIKTMSSCAFIEIGDPIKNKEKIVKTFLFNHTSKHIFLIFGESKEKLVFSPFLKELLNKKRYNFAFKLYPDVKIENKQESETKKAKELFSFLENKLNLKLKYNLKNPDIVFSEVIINEKSFFGINLSGRDMSKRDYKIYKTNQSIKGTIASLALIFGEYLKNKTQNVLDPICKEGTIPIEASLYKLNQSPYKYESDKFLITRIKQFKQEVIKQMGGVNHEFFIKKTKKTKKTIFCFDKEFKNIDFSKKNASVCQVAKEINFSKIDIGWLDIKINSKKINLVITKIPLKFKTEEQEKNFYKLFFNRVSKILEPHGKIILISNKKPILSKEFKIKDKIEIFSGKEKYVFYKIIKD